MISASKTAISNLTFSWAVEPDTDEWCIWKGRAWALDTTWSSLTVLFDGALKKLDRAERSCYQNCTWKYYKVLPIRIL